MWQTRYDMTFEASGKLLLLLATLVARFTGCTWIHTRHEW